ncbi:MAG: hypothetical protein ACRDAM_15945 [Casimicrobium sp.]
MNAQPQVTEICIGRLYSLGNFEHIRYEVRVSVPDTSDPNEVLKNLVDAIDSLQPKPPHSDWAISNARKDAVDQNVTVAQQEAARKIVKEYEAWLTAKEEAGKRFSNLGGTTKQEIPARNFDDE